MELSENISFLPKIYLACNILFALLVFFKSIDPYAISYTFSQTFMQIALWRPITAIFYLGRIGLTLPFQLAFAYLATNKISTKVYRNESTADLVWLLVISVLGLMIFSTFISLYFYANSFVMIMLTMWAMQHPVDTVKIGKAEIFSVYWPIIYCGIMILFGSSYKNYMAGFLIGLLYGFLKSPQFIREFGDFLPTPSFLKSFFRFDVYQMERRRVEQVRRSQRDERSQRSQRNPNPYFVGEAYSLS